MKWKSPKQWVSEDDQALLNGIKNGLNYRQLENLLNASESSIIARLKQLGYKGYKDAKKQLQGGLTYGDK